MTILLDIVLVVIIAILLRVLLLALKTGNIELYYGEKLSPDFKKEPISFSFIFAVILLVCMFFIYLLMVRWL